MIKYSPLTKKLKFLKNFLSSFKNNEQILISIFDLRVKCVENTENIQVIYNKSLLNKDGNLSEKIKFGDELKIEFLKKVKKNNFIKYYFKFNFLEQ